MTASLLAGQITGIERDALLFFFFQAEDGIRDDLVTGVQTCALPIYRERRALLHRQPRADVRRHRAERRRRGGRSEERRVGKECRSRWSPDHEKKKINVQRLRLRLTVRQEPSPVLRREQEHVLAKDMG